MTKKKIAVLVSNPCTIDGRVMRMINAVKDDYEVTAFCVLKPDFEVEENIDGVTYKRFVWNPSLISREQFKTKYPNANPKDEGYRERLKAFVVKHNPDNKHKAFTHAVLDDLVEYNPDLIHAHDLVCLDAGVAAKQETGAKLIYDAHELETDRNPPLPMKDKFKVYFEEKGLANKADAVITVNWSIQDILQKRIKHTPVHVIRNSASIGEYTGVPLRKQLGLLERDKLMVYCGNAAQGRGLEHVARALQHLPGVTFVCVGNTSEAMQETLKQEAGNNAHQLAFLPPVDVSEVSDFIKDADIGVCPIEPATKSYRLSLPNKISEMGNAGLPVVATDLPEIQSFLRSANNPFKPVKPYKLKKIYKDILKAFDIIANMTDTSREIMRNHIKQAARKTAWPTEEERFRAIVADVINA